MSDPSSASRNDPARAQQALDIARYCARRFCECIGPSADHEEVESASLLGAAVACCTYDPTRGAKFSTWCFRVIWQRIQQDNERNDWLGRADRACVRAMRARGVEPVGVLQRPVSIDTLRDEGMEPIVADTRPGPERLAVGQWIHDYLCRLEPRDRELLTDYHFRQLTYRQLARRLGVSSQTVCRRLQCVRARLREMIEAENEP